VTQTCGTLHIAPVAGRPDLQDWLTVPRRANATDPAWVPVPDFFEKRRISPRHAPFFAFGEAALFIARRDGEPVGRISAQRNDRHLQTHEDGTGHFGFFDCLNDEEAAVGLVAAAAEWLSSRGLNRMVGPVSFSLNEEAGCLVEGFDTAPAILMPHHPAWAGRLLERCGLAKEIDLLAYRNPNVDLPPAAARVAAKARANPRVDTRPLNMRRFGPELRQMFDIAGDAWRDNWGFVPFAEAEIRNAIRELRPILRPELGQFLTVDGEDVGFLLVLPNVNEIFARLSPRRLALLDPLRVYGTLLLNPPRTFRVPLMGIRQAHQASPLGGMLLAALCGRLGALSQRYRPQWTEMSWILETNSPMIRLAEMFGGAPVKRYRIYAKDL
jgi:hypothetical protein